jgi:hypothetical protein
MSANLSLYSLTIAAGDATQNNNPALRFVDWKRSLQNLTVNNPRSEQVIVPAGESKTLFDGARTLSIDGTTQLDLSLSTLGSDRYRLEFAGGTDPVFRTNRVVTGISGVSQTLTVLNNGTLQVVAASGTPFVNIQVGDEVLIKGLMTGDASSPFSAINQGRWTVLGKASSLDITLVRPSGEDFQGVDETVSPTNNNQIIAYSQAGVQVGDKMALSDTDLPVSARRTYEVLAVTSKFVEFRSTAAIADASLTPDDAIQFYVNGKRFTRIEADQECDVQVNGTSAGFNVVSPWLAGDPAQVGEYVHTGPVWSLTVTNLSNQPLHLNVITAE